MNDLSDVASGYGDIGAMDQSMEHHITGEFS